MPPDKTWTPQQREAFTATGTSVLVSAAAGAGKTAVLAERCAYLVCDAPVPSEVDKLLVVTFTEAAALEMKHRIDLTLRQRLASSDDARLRRQLALLDRAQVSTLHGFCARVLRQYFHRVDLDANFTVLDADEAQLLCNEVCRELFQDRYERDADGVFARFIDDYGDGMDDALMARVRRTQELLCSLIDPQAWMRQARQRLDDVPTLEGEWKAVLGQRLRQLEARCARAADAAHEAAPKYEPLLRQMGQAMADWRDRLETRGFDALAEAALALEPLRKPSMEKDAPGRAVVEPAFDAIRDDIWKDLRPLARFTAAQWRAAIERSAGPGRVFLDLVSEFDRRYAQAKREVRGVDFADLEILTLRILRDPRTGGPSDAARSFQRQFDHVLVDEYQDINEVQDAILGLVSREHDTQLESNLFTVGDVKQSIYRFRLAEPNQFLERQRRFKTAQGNRRGRAIDLQANFRSRAPLLEVVNGVFARLMSPEAAEIDYDDTHALHAGQDYPPPGDAQFRGSPVELHLLPRTPAAGDDDGTPGVELDSAEREAALVARRIRALTGQDGGRPMQITEKIDGQWHARALHYGDVVVLLRSLQHKADQFARLLQAMGVPAHRDRGRDFFDSVEVRDIQALLALLDNAQQDIPLAAVLRSPLAGLADASADLARIRAAYPDEDVPFHQAAARYAAEHDDDLAAHLRRFWEQLHRWRDVARQRPPAELIRQVYDDTGYLAYVSGLENGAQRTANLLYLHERARQFAGFARQGLARFAQFLQRLENERDIAQPSVLGAGDDVVRIMSIHASKGQEFPVVFVVDLGKRINMEDLNGPILVDRRRFAGLKVADPDLRVRYPSPAWLVVADALRRQTLAEELRVLYVAMTRAREHLVLVGTCRESALAQWRGLYGSHRGKFSAEVVLGAKSMLDWIGPAAVAAGDGDFSIIAADAPSAVGIGAASVSERRDAQSPAANLTNLQPLDPAPAINPVADEVVVRLTQPYAYQQFVTVPAVESVTALVKQDGAVVPSPGSPGEGQGEGLPSSADQLLPTPQCMLAAPGLSAADAGSATHLVLRHLDFSCPCAGTDLEDQIASLVDRRVISPAQAQAVQRPAVEWLMATDLGGLMRVHAGVLRREMDFALAIDPAQFALGPSPAAPQDQTMVRGKIDLLIPLDGHFVLVDYKTDRVSGPALQARAESYRPQVALYRQAVQDITGRRVSKAWLIFLTAHQSIEA